MAKAVVDPEEVRQFAMTLKKFVGGLRQSMTQVHGQMTNLGQTWRDQEHAKFAAEFEDTLRALQRFTETAEEHIPFLIRKAERIEEYLKQR